MGSILAETCSFRAGLRSHSPPDAILFSRPFRREQVYLRMMYVPFVCLLTPPISRQLFFSSLYHQHLALLFTQRPPFCEHNRAIHLSNADKISIILKPETRLLFCSSNVLVSRRLEAATSIRSSAIQTVSRLQPLQYLQFA